jgi:adenylate cyclase
MVDNVFDDIRSIKGTVDEITASLNSQRDILQKRGMNLPPNSIQNLQGIELELGKLNDRIVNDQTEVAQLRKLASTSALLNSSLEFDRVLEEAMEQVIVLSEAERGYLVLYDRTTEALEFRVTRENEPDPLPPQEKVSMSILREVLTSGDALLSDNAHGDARVAHSPTIALKGLRSVLCVPLKHRERVIGAVYVDNRLRTGVFTAREKALLIAFANQAAVAIENARLFNKIQKTLNEITEMKELLDSVFASVASGVITLDGQDKIISANDAAQLILGKQAMLGLPIQPALPFDLGDTLDEVRDGKTLTHEEILEAPNAKPVYISVKFSPLRGNGQPIGEQQAGGITIVVDDVTVMRERAQSMDTVQRYLPGALLQNIDMISKLALGGERRMVTCMFVECYAYAHIPDTLRPSERMMLLNEYLAVAVACIQRHGGIIDKYMGNEIMVQFNTQLNPLEDHAYRAVCTALDIRAAFVPLCQARGLTKPPYRAGMNTGIATLGNVGSQRRRDFTSIGDNINLSKRLEENAPYGSIIISEDTYKQIQSTHPQHGLVLQERDPLQVKGRDQTTRVYEVLRAE